MPRTMLSCKVKRKRAISMGRHLVAVEGKKKDWQGSLMNTAALLWVYLQHTRCRSNNLLAVILGERTCKHCLQSIIDSRIQFVTCYLVMKLATSTSLHGCNLTCPATANPSARRDVASQSWQQIWKPAMMVGPWRAARDAASVTQNVTATTLASSRNPETEIKFSLLFQDTSVRDVVIRSLDSNGISPHPRNRPNFRDLMLGGITSTCWTSRHSNINVIRYLQ